MNVAYAMTMYIIMAYMPLSCMRMYIQPNIGYSKPLSADSGWKSQSAEPFFDCVFTGPDLAGEHSMLSQTL